MSVASATRALGPAVAGCEPLTVPAPYAVWRIDLRAPLAARAAELLSSEERARAQRFAFELHRHRYLGAHTALRRLLAERLGVEGEALGFGAGPQGKPHLHAPHASLGFNLSDSDDIALIALAPGAEIGVDVEVLRAVPDARELAASHFTAAERAALAEVPTPAGRDRRFLTGWTRKEACLKAIGSGLSIGAHTFDAGLDDAPRRVGIPVGEETVWVEVQSIAAGDDCVAAVARRVEAAAEGVK